jgi:hypothetical protein
MKSKISIIIALTILFLVGSSLVSAQQNDAALELKSSVIQANVGDEFEVEVVVKNPGVQNIISVRSWLSYDVNALEGVSVNTQDSPFTLSAPGEDEFDADGRAKIGRSNISGGFQDLEGVVAKVRFKVKTADPMTTVISPYDYQVTELGHVSVNIIDQGFPVNILSEKPEEVQIELNPGAMVPVDEPPVEPVMTPDIGGGGFANLVRPQNLKADTGPGYVDLKWDLSDEVELMGYNIYYGKTSGQYTRRRTVGKINRYRIDGLINGEAYYFAVTAYDQLNRESDYSDEVGIIVNQPLSSTSPFEDILAMMLAKLPTQPQNGPLLGWLVFSATGLGGAFMFRKRRYNDTTIQRHNETIKIS